VLYITIRFYSSSHLAMSEKRACSQVSRMAFISSAYDTSQLSPKLTLVYLFRHSLIKYSIFKVLFN